MMSLTWSIFTLIHLHGQKVLLKRMGLARRMRTTGKVEIREAARKEAEVMCLHTILAIVASSKFYYQIRPNTSHVCSCVPSRYGQKRSKVSFHRR